MDYQQPGSEREPQQLGTVENDFVRPLTPMRNVSHRRLPAALPFAIAGILVVSSVAFGATVIRNTVTPPPDASAVVVGDDNPSESPSLEITEAPTAEITAEPTVAATPVTPLTLQASIVGGKVKLEWTRYQGEDFSYYKVVRSTDATVSWPLGDGDTLVAAIDNIDTLSTVDAAPGGKSFTYEVFAVKSSEDGYAVLVGSNVVTIAVPAPTPAPTSSCGIGPLSFKIHVPTTVGGIQPANAGSGYSVSFSWHKYMCDNFELYVIVKSSTSNIVVPLGSGGSGDPIAEYGNVSTTSGADYNVQPGHTYYYLVMAWTSKTLCYGGTVLAKTQIVKVVIPS